MLTIVNMFSLSLFLLKEAQLNVFKNKTSLIAFFDQGHFNKQRPHCISDPFNSTYWINIGSGVELCTRYTCRAVCNITLGYSEGKITERCPWVHKYNRKILGLT